MMKQIEPPFSVVLVMPDIPQNAGNIGRLCLATGCELVLVRPLGFRLTDAFLLRSGMDYWKRLSPVVLDDLDTFVSWLKGRRSWFLSAHGERNYAQVAYQKGDVFCFGSESSGFPEEILSLAKTQKALITLPMVPGVRCLNVSSAAAAMVYEGIRQINGWGFEVEP
ncbi:MAG: tRNA (cytidine(34)-2'-O)-methyltransferase [Candidatus Ozemobacteraceae bacterium]